ncbi:cytochrome P450 [Streptomyces sp. NPDC059979]|uniref:cytochrome P450 family protein n=1 Tax=unclassified Streptomyces TaxID=2593676 RepID=UPI003661D535
MSGQESMAPLYSREFISHPYPTYAFMRDEGPVRRITQPNGLRCWLVTRHEEARALFADPRVLKDPGNAGAALAEASLPHYEEAGAGLDRHMLSSDPPDHTRLRKLVTKAFTPKRVKELGPSVQRVTDKLLDRMAVAGEADLIADFALPLTVTVICELLGIPANRRSDIHRWTDALISPAPGAGSRAATATALRDMHRYLADLIEAKRADSRDDLVSAMIEAQDEGGSLTAEETVSMIYLLLIAGHETTVNLIGNGVFALLRHPEQLRKVQRDPELLPGAIEEMLRYEGPIGTASMRFTAEPVQVGETTIGAGEVVLIVVGSANRDERRHPRPDEFDVERADTRHLSFGHGIHYCLGAPLARMEGRIAIGSLLERFPGLRLAVEPEQLTWRSGNLIRGLHRLPVVVGKPGG